MKFLYEGGSAEIVEKKSRFIATCRPVSSEEEALAFIAEMKKKYWNATHNCPAYVIGERSELARCSDDGEPQGTAGRPMLSVLQQEDIHNCAVVVTRYFGGTLLGTGGLVRAYSRSVQEGLAASVIADRQDGYRLRIRTDYNGAGKIQYLLAQAGVPLLDTAYTDTVEMAALVPAPRLHELTEAITEKTAGRAQYLAQEPVRYAEVRGEYVFFE